MQRLKRPQSLPGRNNRIMIRNLLIIRITRLSDLFIAFILKYCFCKYPYTRNIAKPADIFADFLCYCCRKHPGIRTRICNQLLLIQLLHNAKRLIRTDLKKSGTCILQFCQIIQKRCIFCFFFLFGRKYGRPDRRMFGQMCNQLLRIFFFLKTIFLVQLRRLLIRRAFHRFPFTLYFMVLNVNP